MKNRKKIIVPLLLVAAMVVSIGYAALTSTLTINGSAALDNRLGFIPDDIGGSVIRPMQMYVYFTQADVEATNVKFIDGNGNVTTETVKAKMGAVVLGNAAAGDLTSDTGMAFSAGYKAIGLKQKGDYVTFKFTIKNASSDVDAYLRQIDVTEGTVYDASGAGTPTQIPSGNYFTTTVRIAGAEMPLRTDLQTESPLIKTGKTLDVYVTLTLNQTLGSNGAPEIITMDSSEIDFVFKDATS